jgi:hypothetical protein
MPVSIVAIAAAVLIGMAVTPVPVIFLLIRIQSRIIAVLFARVPVGPIRAVGAVLVTVPTMVVAMVGIVVTNCAASGGYGSNKGESQNEWSHVIQCSIHIC